VQSDERVQDDERGDDEKEERRDGNNRSIPCGLKNAIDWASWPYGRNSFARSRRPSTLARKALGRLLATNAAVVN
jgi:hypothetical protein